MKEVTAIWRAIQSGDPDLAERCCVDHVRGAAEAALAMIAESLATTGSAPTTDRPRKIAARRKT